MAPSTGQKEYLVFIDWDGTLCYDRFWKDLRDDTSPYREIGKKIDEFLFVKNKRLVRGWMKGKYSSEEINTLLSKELDIPYKFLWESFVRGARNMRMNPEAGREIKELRKYAHVCLITGNMDSFSRFTVKSQRLSDYFDIIINSYERRRLKTEYRGREFKHIANSLGIDLKDTFLIEDSLKSCQTFKELGGTSFQVHDEMDTVNSLQKIKAGLPQKFKYNLHQK